MAEIEEQLEVLNEKGEKTGEVISRSIAHREGILHGASHTYIYKKENGKIYMLLQRRSDTKDSFPGCLDISSAGHMPEGIDFRETAQKELEEELGIKVEGTELVEAFTQRFSKVSEHHGETFNNQEINKIYLLKRDVDITKVKLQEEEVSEVLWVDTETIAERIQAGDEEYCLDKEEFEKVLEMIKEREKMKEDYMKKLYEDLIISGRFHNTPVISALYDQNNEYGENRQIEVILKGECAASIVSSLPEAGDKEVAKAIAMGVALGKPVFGEIGDNFIKSKVRDYSKSSLGVALTKVVLSKLSGERIDKIILGVKKVLEQNEILSQEEKAAKLANEIFDLTSKLTKDQNSERSCLIMQVLEEVSANGIISMPDTLELEKLYERDGIRTEQKYSQYEYDLLNSAFEYYVKNNNEIPQRFKSDLTGHSLEEIVTYYVLSKGESELKKIQTLSKEGPIK